jgi:hypothetical protein
LLLAHASDETETTVFHVYEGNFYWILILGNVLRCRPNAKAYINLFWSYKI